VRTSRMMMLAAAVQKTRPLLLAEAMWLDYESSRGSPVTVAGAGAGTGTVSDSVSSPHNTQASKTPQC
jgi:hypothetical protein